MGGDEEKLSISFYESPDVEMVGILVMLGRYPNRRRGEGGLGPERAYGGPPMQTVTNSNRTGAKSLGVPDRVLVMAGA